MRGIVAGIVGEGRSLIAGALREARELVPSLPTAAYPQTTPERIYDLERRAEQVEYVMWGVGIFLLVIILIRGVKS